MGMGTTASWHGDTIDRDVPVEVGAAHFRVARIVYAVTGYRGLDVGWTHKDLVQVRWGTGSLR